MEDLDVDQSLFYSIERNDMSLLHDAIHRGANVDMPDLAGWRPIHVASFDGNSAIVAALIDAGAEVNHPSLRRMTPLALAASQGHHAVVVQLLRQFAHLDASDLATLINTRFASARTALHFAAMGGHIHCVEELLSRKAAVNALDGARQTPLHLAALHGRTECVRELLRCDAAINAIDSANRTPLQLALPKCHRDGFAATITLLVSRGARVSRRQPSPLHWAARTNQTHLARFLLSNKANVNERIAKSGMTPLHIAVQNSQSAMAKLLISFGANPTIVNVRALVRTAAAHPLTHASRQRQNAGKNPAAMTQLEWLQALLRNASTCQSRTLTVGARVLTTPPIAEPWQWSLENHCRSPAKVQRIVETMLLIRSFEPTSILSLIPNELWFLIFEYFDASFC